MAPGAIVFAMANPVPEVQPEDIGEDVAIVATGRSDYPNQINNVLAFPGVFRGLLDASASSIDDSLMVAAAHAIASAAAIFIPSVIRVARTWSAPAKIPGKASTLLIWFG